MSVRSLLLGIDVSPRRLGWGLVDLVTGEPVACGCEAIDLPDHGWSHQQIARALRAIHTSSVCGGCGGKGHVGSGPDLDGCHLCKGWGRTGEVQAVYIERPALPPKSGANSAFNAGQAVGICRDECERRWPHAPVQTLQPSEWRKLAGLPGNASKAYVWEQAWQLAADFAVSMPDHAPRSQDAADALLIAVAGQRRNAENWDRAVATGAA